jgi:hypothetical protein
MAKTYKVWVEVEEYDEDTGDGETLDMAGASVAQFKDVDEAMAFAERLQAIGESLPLEVQS